MWLDAARRTVARLETLLYPAGRLAVLASLAFLWQSFFWLSEVPLLTRAGFLLLTLLAAVRPADALLVTAALATLGGPLAALTGAEASRGAEALVLAFLVGWTARTLVLRQRPTDSLGRLAAPLLILGFVIVCSLVVTVLVVQQATEPAASYFSKLLAGIATQYLGWFDPQFTHWQTAALFLEGLLLLAATSTLCAAQPDLPRRIVRMVAAGAAAAGLLSFVRLAMGLLRSLEPLSLLESVLRNQLRLTFHVGDVNAAGSHFVLAIFIVLGLAFASRTWLARTGWLLLAVPVFAGLWLSGSRTAVMAGAVAAFTSGVLLVVKRRVVAWTVIAATVVAGAAAGFATIELPEVITDKDVLTQNAAPYGEVGVRTGMATRAWFLQTSYRMWRDSPVFGVGIGYYAARSREFMPEPLKQLYSSENAHNYFAQVAAELGLVGFAAFAWLLWAAFRTSGARAPRPPTTMLAAGVGTALGAYLLTCLAGHPLLVQQAAYAFWITLGVYVVGFSDTPQGVPSQKLRRGWILLVVVVLVVGLPFRAVSARRDIDLSSVRYGFSLRHTDPETGDRFRLAGPRSTVFVPVGTSFVVLSMSPETEDSAAIVELRLDGKLANRLKLDGRSWRETRLLMPQGSDGRRFRRLDIIVLPDAQQTAGTEARIRVREVQMVRQ